MPIWTPPANAEARNEGILRHNTRINAGDGRGRLVGGGHRRPRRRVSFEEVPDRGAAPSNLPRARTLSATGASRAWAPGNNAAPIYHPAVQQAILDSASQPVAMQQLAVERAMQTAFGGQNAAQATAIRQALNNIHIGPPGNQNAARLPALQHPDVQRALNNIGARNQEGNQNAPHTLALAYPAVQRALNLSNIAGVDWLNSPVASPAQPVFKLGGFNPYSPPAAFSTAPPPMIYYPPNQPNNHGYNYFVNAPAAPGLFNPGETQAALARQAAGHQGGAANLQLLQHVPNPNAKYWCQEKSDGGFTERTMQDIVKEFSPGHWQYSQIGKQYWVQH